MKTTFGVTVTPTLRANMSSVMRLLAHETGCQRCRVMFDLVRRLRH